MVLFNGVSLESISNTIHVIQCVVSQPAINPVTIAPTLADGEIFARRRYGTRTVTITFVVMDNNTTNRAATIRKIYQWAHSSTEKKLVVPQESNGYLNAVCTELPTNAGREYWQTLGLVFTCYDPFYHANTEKNCSVSQTVVVSQFENTDWRIEQTVSTGLTYPQWSLDGLQISFNVLTAGALKINGSTHTATTNDGSVLPALMFGSRFFTLKTGNNSIETSNGAGGTIYWRERWL